MSSRPFVTMRLERLFQAVVGREVHVEAGETRDLAFGVAVGAAPALDPRRRPVMPDDPEDDLPRIPGL